MGKLDDAALAERLWEINNELTDYSIGFDEDHLSHPAIETMREAARLCARASKELKKSNPARKTKSRIVPILGGKTDPTKAAPLGGKSTGSPPLGGKTRKNVAPLGRRASQ